MPICLCERKMRWDDAMMQKKDMPKKLMDLFFTQRGMLCSLLLEAASKAANTLLPRPPNSPPVPPIPFTPPPSSGSDCFVV